jgi:hypothetical protein
MRLVSRGERHPRVQRKGLKSLTLGSSRPEEVHAALDQEGAVAKSLWRCGSSCTVLRGLLAKGAAFGRWRTLPRSASGQGLHTEKQVSGETIRATFQRLGVRWEEAKRWIESPDPGYERKKGLSSD